MRSCAEGLEVNLADVRDCCFKTIAAGSIQFDARHAYELVVENLFKVCSKFSPEIGNADPNMLAESNPIAEGIDPDFPMTDMIHWPWRSWTFNYPLTYCSKLLKKVAAMSHNFPPYKLEVADYCLTGGEGRYDWKCTCFVMN